MREYKIVVLGIAGVGKSAITVRFVQDIFVDKYDPTVEDSYTKILQIGEEEYVLEILDTAGTETMSALRDLYMINGQGFMLVYSVCETQTLQDLPDIRDQIRRVKETDQFPHLVVGNKCDLESDRKVSLEQGDQFIKERFGANIPHIETSAKTGKNIEAAFTTLIKLTDQHFGVKGVKPNNTKKSKDKSGKKIGCKLL